MKKAVVVFSVVLALFSGSLTLASASTIKPGTTCSKSGAVTTQKGIKYICVSLNKKLTWKVLATAPSHTHVTPPVTTPSIAPTPSSNNATTSADLVLNTVDYVPAPPAGGSDDYRCFLLDPKFTLETFLKAVTITPNNLDVSHHGIRNQKSQAGHVLVILVSQELLLSHQLHLQVGSLSGRLVETLRSIQRIRE